MKTCIIAVTTLLFAFVASSETLDLKQKVEAAEKLFYYITQPVPNLKIIADIELHEKPWTEEKIRQTVAGAQFDQNLALHPEQKSNIEAVIRTNVESLRKQHSGTNFLRVCEWIGPKVYRRDLLALSGDPMTNSFKSAKNVKYAWANIYDSTFSEYVSWRANPVTGGATVSKDKTTYITDNLWESMVIAPEDAFAFLIIVKDGQFALSQEATWLSRSLAPLRSKLSEPRLQALVAGKNTTWTMNVELSELDEIPCVVLSLRFKNAMDSGITYFMDWPSQLHLLKVVRAAPTENVIVTTTRRQFDTNGIPREWVTSGQTEDKPLLYKRILIDSAEVNPKWDLDSVFVPVFPKLYTVDEVTAGVSHNVQWGSIFPKPSILSAQKPKLIRNIFLAINAVVLCFLTIYWKKGKTRS